MKEMSFINSKAYLITETMLIRHKINTSVLSLKNS